MNNPYPERPEGLTNEAFLAEVFKSIDPRAFMWVAGVNGEPDKAKGTDWRGRAVKPGRPLNLADGQNTFYCVSSLKAVPGGAVARQTDNFDALHVVVLDDVGTKAELPPGLEPSYLLETSPGSFQAGLLIAEPLADLKIASALYQALAAGGYSDPGAKGPQARYMRLPVGVNLKAKCGPEGWRHRLASWHPERRFTVAQVTEAFGLDLESQAGASVPPAPVSDSRRSAPAKATEVSDTSVIAKLLRSPKAARLWDGGSEGFGSGSDADEHLLVMLAYQGLGESQIERVYSMAPRASRKSSDGVAKWQTRADYRKRSIAAALRYAEEHPQGDTEGAKATVEAALAIVKAGGDPRPFLADEVLSAMAVLKLGAAADFEHYRKQAKAAGIGHAVLDKQLDALAGAGSMLHAVAAERALEVLGGADSVTFTQGQWWAWTGQVWERIETEEVIKQAVHKVLPLKQITAANVGSVVSVMRTMAATTEPMRSQLDGFTVNCLSGTLTLRDVGMHKGFKSGFWELKPHCKEDRLTSLVPVPFESQVGCPSFLKFLESITSNDAPDEAQAKQRAIVEAIAYSLMSTASLERFVILYGESSSNGKSTLLKLIEALAGNANTSALSVSQLGERFALAGLEGKLVNLCSEISRGEVLPDRVVKTLASGDSITVERKGKDLYELRPSATLWFATNALPSLKDLSPATLEKRCLLLQLTRSFEGDAAKDVNLLSKLLDELPGIMAWCLDWFASSMAIANTPLEWTVGLDGQGGCKLVPTYFGGVDHRPLQDPPLSTAAKAAWRLDADPVQQFVTERVVIGRDFFVQSSELFKAFTAWREANGVKLDLTSRTLTNRIKQIVPTIETGDAVRVNKQRGVRGIALVEVEA